MNSSALQAIVVIAVIVFGIPILRTFDRIIELGLDLWIPMSDTCCCHGDAYSQLTNRVIDTLVRDRTPKAQLERLEDAAATFVALSQHAIHDSEWTSLRKTIDELVDFENRHQATRRSSVDPVA